MTGMMGGYTLGLYRAVHENLGLGLLSKVQGCKPSECEIRDGRCERRTGEYYTSTVDCGEWGPPCGGIL